MKVAVFNTKSYERKYLGRSNADGKHGLTYFEASLNLDTCALTNGFNAVCLSSERIDKQTISKLAENGIKLIDLRTAGFDNVDVKAANDQHIKVMRVPAYSPQAIAEHATALILTLNRKTHKAYNRVRENNFSLENLIGFNLSGKVVGVVGTGNIGSAFCSIMLGFGCTVVACDIKESEPLKKKGVHYISLDELLKASAIISIHCPLTPETLHLFNDITFSKMKKGMMLINTSRGAVIKTTDAITALKNGQLGYLGLDVYEQELNLFSKDLSESVIQDDLIERLMSFNNVLITPHQGFFTNEALDQIGQITIQNFNDFENGVELANEIKV